MTQNATVDYRNPMLAVEKEGEPIFYGLGMAAWLKIAIVTLLMVATFRFNLLRLWLKTNPFSGEPNWRHAICVPLIGFYYLFVHRDELLETKAYTAWSGLGILLLGILLFAYGIYPGQNDFVKDFGMVVALFGVVALLCGWRVMKIAWFPIVFLVCAIPWPELVYSYIASPLQRLAAGVAVGVLRALNVTSLNSGTKIIINAKGNTWRTLNVAEACAGLRSLMTFISVAAAIAFLSARPLWQKIIVTFMAIPIAIFCNVMRVTGQGLLDHYWSQELSEGFAHQFVGIVMLVPGFFMILFVGWLLDVVFIEVVDERELRRNRATIIKPATKPMEAVPQKIARLESAVKPQIPAPVAAVASGPTVKLPAMTATTPAAKPAIPPTVATKTTLLPVAPKVAERPPQAPVAKPPLAKPITATQPGVRPASTPLPAGTAPTSPTMKPAVAVAPRPVAKPTAPALTTPRPAGLTAIAPAATAKPIVGATSAVKPGTITPAVTAGAGPAAIRRPAASIAPSIAIKPQTPGAPVPKPPTVPISAVRVAAPVPAPVKSPVVPAPKSPESPEAK